MILRAFHDNELNLLNSVEGYAAFTLLLPLIRAVAMFIAGADRALPPELAAIPDLQSDAALERARYRSLKHGIERKR